MLDITKALESIQRVKLRGGVVGKMTLLLIVVACVLGAVCFTIGNPHYIIVIVIIVSALVFYGMKRCFDFAEKHPQAAIMEGAEFLVHEQLLHASKETPRIEAQLNQEIDHEPPLGQENPLEPDRSVKSLDEGKP